MTNDENKKALDRDDLFLLMESYRNMIESNLTLMEKQTNILDKIDSACRMIEQFSNSIQHWSKEVNEHHKKCAETQKNNIESLQKIITNGEQSTHDEHSNFNFKFYGLVATLCTIIIGLIGLIFKIWHHHTP